MFQIGGVVRVHARNARVILNKQKEHARLGACHCAIDGHQLDPTKASRRADQYGKHWRQSGRARMFLVLQRWTHPPCFVDRSGQGGKIRRRAQLCDSRRQAVPSRAVSPSTASPAKVRATPGAQSRKASHGVDEVFDGANCRTARGNRTLLFLLRHT